MSYYHEGLRAKGAVLKTNSLTTTELNTILGLLLIYMFEAATIAKITGVSRTHITNIKNLVRCPEAHLEYVNYVYDPENFFKEVTRINKYLLDKGITTPEDLNYICKRKFFPNSDYDL
jgi:hypothetical protein